MRAALLVVGALAACSSRGTETTSERPPFALVEVFTSEGCDSCPVADDYVNALVARESVRPRRVFAIAWHIDYWDYMGWKDPFDSDWATTRQQAYEDLNKTTIGTPEMFVNGGSGTYDTAALQAAIDRALRTTANATVELSLLGSADATILPVGYRVAGAPDDAQLVVVLVESGLVGKPTAGELAGRTLRHDNVARAYVVAPATIGSVSFAVPTAVRRDQASLIAFVQQKGTLRILGAAQIDLHP